MVACAATLLCAQQPTDAPSKVIALENAWSRALEMKDTKAVDAILDNAIVFVDLHGRLMSKADVLADAKTAHTDQVVTESMNVSVHGNTAVVTGIIRQKGTQGGKPYLQRGRFTDVWMDKQGTWVCIASQLTLISP